MNIGKTNYKAIADSTIQELEENGNNVPDKHYDDFVKGLMQNDVFAESMVATMMEVAKKAAGVMMNTDNKEDAIEMSRLNTINRPMMKFAWICFYMGVKSCETKQMDKMFEASILDSQEPA